jgi:hypothetical protein
MVSGSCRRASPVKGACEGAVLERCACGWWGELCLSAVAMRRDDVPARQIACRSGAEFSADDTDAQVQAGCKPGARQHVAVVDVQSVRPNVGPREVAREVVGVGPVRCDGSVVDQSDLAEDERADADAQDRRAAPVRRTERVERFRGDRCVVRKAPRYDDEVSAAQRIEPERDEQVESVRRRHGARPYRTGLHREPPWHAGPTRPTPERLDRTREIESDDPVKSERDDTQVGHDRKFIMSENR